MVWFVLSILFCVRVSLSRFDMYDNRDWKYGFNIVLFDKVVFGILIVIYDF